MDQNLMVSIRNLPQKYRVSRRLVVRLLLTHVWLESLFLCVYGCSNSPIKVLPSFVSEGGKKKRVMCKAPKIILVM